MKLYTVHDPAFAPYGKVLTGYDMTELFRVLAEQDCPKAGISYTAQVSALEQTAVAEEFRLRMFGGMPIQVGCTTGTADTLNALEYHKSSEINAAGDDCILVLGREQDIVDGRYDTKKAEAFLIKAGEAVELYGTTLHYAPWQVSGEGYRMVCVLPLGTNAARPDLTVKCEEDRFCFGSNKWLLAHADSGEAENGAYVGLSGKNLTRADVEE